MDHDESYKRVAQAMALLPPDVITTVNEILSIDKNNTVFEPAVVQQMQETLKQQESNFNSMQQCQISVCPMAHLHPNQGAKSLLVANFAKSPVYACNNTRIVNAELFLPQDLHAKFKCHSTLTMAAANTALQLVPVTVIAKLRHHDSGERSRVIQAYKAAFANESDAFVCYHGYNMVESMTFSWLAMEPMHTSLEHWCQLNATAIQPFDPQRILMARKAVKCVTQFHSLGMAHGDIKPANMLIDTARMKLTDFDTVTFPVESDKVDLSPSCYLHPQRQTAKTFIAQQVTDMYSLAIVIIEVLCAQSMQGIEITKQIPAFWSNKYSNLWFVLYECCTMKFDEEFLSVTANMKYLQDRMKNIPDELKAGLGKAHGAVTKTITTNANNDNNTASSSCIMQ